MGLNRGTQVPEFVALSEGKENDMVQGRQFVFLKGSVEAFDKGYVDYQWFKSLTEQGGFFVTRLRTKALNAVQARRAVDREAGIRSAQIIQFNLFERRSFREIVDPDPPRHKKNEPQ